MDICAIIFHLKRSCWYGHQLFKDFTIFISFLTVSFFQNVYILDLTHFTHFRQRGDISTIPYHKPEETQIML